MRNFQKRRKTLLEVKEFRGKLEMQWIDLLGNVINVNPMSLLIY